MALAARATSGSTPSSMSTGRTLSMLARPDSLSSLRRGGGGSPGGAYGPTRLRSLHPGTVLKADWTLDTHSP